MVNGWRLAADGIRALVMEECLHKIRSDLEFRLREPGIDGKLVGFCKLFHEFLV